MLVCVLLLDHGRRTNLKVNVDSATTFAWFRKCIMFRIIVGGVKKYCAWVLKHVREYSVIARGVVKGVTTKQTRDQNMRKTCVRLFMHAEHINIPPERSPRTEWDREGRGGCLFRHVTDNRALRRRRVAALPCSCPPHAASLGERGATARSGSLRKAGRCAYSTAQAATAPWT